MSKYWDKDSQYVFLYKCFEVSNIDRRSLKNLLPLEDLLKLDDEKMERLACIIGEIYEERNFYDYLVEGLNLLREEGAFK